MKVLIISLSLVMVSAEAHAISRHNSNRMTCDAVQQTIRAEGASIMRYASKRVAGMTLYGRYVRNSNYCKAEEAATRAYIPASDTNSCQVYECKQIEFDDDLFFRRR